MLLATDIWRPHGRPMEATQSIAQITARFASRSAAQIAARIVARFFARIFDRIFDRYYEKFFATETIKKGYGKITYGHSTEAFANFTALSNTDNKEIYIKLMNYYAPQTTRTFGELYERSNLL